MDIVFKSVDKYLAHNADTYGKSVFRFAMYCPLLYSFVHAPFPSNEGKFLLFSIFTQDLFYSGFLFCLFYFVNILIGVYYTIVILVWDSLMTNYFEDLLTCLFSNCIFFNELFVQIFHQHFYYYSIFKLKAKLSVKYREFPYCACPYTCSAFFTYSHSFSLWCCGLNQELCACSWGAMPLSYSQPCPFFHLVVSPLDLDLRVICMF